jgi:5-methyltetrahydropteroyltriglutamate--homocysteine methyltransferase
VVERQLAAGIDFGNDGEQPRVGFQTYVPQGMKGFGGESKRSTPCDMREFPQYVDVIRRRGVLEGTKFFNAPQAIDPLSYDDLSGVCREYDMFDSRPRRGFLSVP